MNETDLEHRLLTIETKLSFLEDFLLRLQEEAVARNALLDRLEAEHRAIKARLLQLSGDQESLPQRRPPHY